MGQDCALYRCESPGPQVTVIRMELVEWVRTHCVLAADIAFVMCPLVGRHRPEFAALDVLAHWALIQFASPFRPFPVASRLRSKGDVVYQHGRQTYASSSGQ